MAEKKKPAVKKAQKPKVKKTVVTAEEIKEDLKKAEAKKEAKDSQKNKPKNETQPKAPKKNKLKKSEKRHSKKYRIALELIEIDKAYPIAEAVVLVKKTAQTKFDSSIDAHIRLGIDPASSEQQVRGSLVLPAGSGKTKKVLAVVSPDKEKEAKEAGADFAGGSDLIEKVEKGWLDFEVVVATPDMMPQLGKIGKILGTKGLMPNPKVGTVTNEIGKTVQSLKKGMVEYRADKSGIIHLSIGRASFADGDLVTNFEELVNTLNRAKPSGVKGTYILSRYLASTMGPGVKVQP